MLRGVAGSDSDGKMLAAPTGPKAKAPPKAPGGKKPPPGPPPKAGAKASALGDLETSRAGQNTRHTAMGYRTETNVMTGVVTHFESLDVNDYPEQARKAVNSRE